MFLRVRANSIIQLLMKLNNPKSKRAKGNSLSLSPITKHISKMECSWLIHIPFRSSILLKQHKIQLFVSSLWRYRRHDIMASHVTVKPESTAERFWGFLANIGTSAAVLPIWWELQTVSTRKGFISYFATSTALAAPAVCWWTENSTTSHYFRTQGS